MISIYQSKGSVIHLSFFVMCVIILYNDNMSLFVIGSIFHCQLDIFLHVSINPHDNIFKLNDPGLSEIEGF